MSTLAAARADNFYYPPEWDPSKGGLNKFQGQHPLRERAKKLDQGILVIRFEMPFNVWCNGCGHLIGKGVRFNAEKKQIGGYFSTKIWNFSMRAPCCSEQIEVQTDPKNHEYVVTQGARRKEETFTAADTETIELQDDADRAKLDDPFSKLERGNEDRRRGREGAERIIELQDDSKAKFKDDYAMNKFLRRQNRAKRHEEKASDARRKELHLPDHITLLPDAAADTQHAALVSFGDPSAFNRRWRNARRDIKNQPIFLPHALPAQLRAGAVGEGKHAQAKLAGPPRAVVRRPVCSAGLALPKGSGITKKRTLADKATALVKRRRIGHGVKLNLSMPRLAS